jgi:eukaryotic-like serine/threonine-protein kinase
MADAIIIQERYELGELIGEGAWGDVHRGRNVQTGETVAIKILKSEARFGLPNAVERFNREAGALRLLNHPNVVKVYEAIVQGDLNCIVMELVSGGSLRDMMDTAEPIPVARVVQIAYQIADALAIIHPSGLVHRDIKPNNILFALDGSVRLTDFGLVRIAGLETITETGMPMGTTHYLSPESLKGETVDARADIWSLGVLIYEMLTGKPPFDGRNLTHIIMNIIKTPMPDIQAQRADCTAELTALLDKMLAKDRDERIATAVEVRDNLKIIYETLG